MHIRLIAAAVLALASATPALAQSMFDTHAELQTPGGKTPIKMYRPLARNACAVGAQHSQPGKIPMAPVVAADRGACDTQIVARETNERRD